MRTHFWLESLKGRDHSEDLLCKWRDDDEMDFRGTGLVGVDLIHL
jgi:hypothetical protein